MSERFSASDIEQWHRDGFVILPEFFSSAEISPIVEDYQQLYGDQLAALGSAIEEKDDNGAAQFNDAQFKNIDSLPYNGGAEMNLISLHPALIAFAKAVLGTQKVHLYQSHSWAKFTGLADYEQPFHCDFMNHTLTVPADDVHRRTVDIIIYYTDVTDAHGALHYVTKPDSDQALRPGAVYAAEPEQQRALLQKQQSAAAPAGTIVAHGIDTFHRGTNLIIDKGYRYTMTVGYKAAGNDMIGYDVWQASTGRDWTRLLSVATPEQLECLGIPLPDDRYWNKRTLNLTQARWPDWDMQPYFEKARLDGRY